MSCRRRGRRPEDLLERLSRTIGGVAEEGGEQQLELNWDDLLKARLYAPAGRTERDMS